MQIHQYPVPRFSAQVIHEWAAELAARHQRTVEAFLAKPNHLIFFTSQTLRIELMDDSAVEFCYAFALVSEARRAIAVFTEHCGHHVFPHHNAKVFCNGELSYAQTTHPGDWSSP
ncbi:hypothetical protein LJR129_001709 [Acidovorax sp. LjRoot129]|uniref:hypothetical protein n=1 Tax=Acidovorax sp. LjRoot129 TaxID=3342260 RepID=UPI003ECC44A7